MGCGLRLLSLIVIRDSFFVICEGGGPDGPQSIMGLCTGNVFEITGRLCVDSTSIFGGQQTRARRFLDGLEISGCGEVAALMGRKIYMGDVQRRGESSLAPIGSRRPCAEHTT